MTEEEAKTKWCPFTRVIAGKAEGAKTAVADNGQSAFNRMDVGPKAVSIPDASLCIASACMAWRWHDVASGTRNEGYCGLAGKP